MYTHSRLTSESSNATNASGSTEQTDLSDETVSDCAKTPKPLSGQGIGHLDAVRNGPAIDSDVECQRRNVHLSEESKHDDYFYMSSDVKEARYLLRNPQGRAIGLKRESVPLLTRSEREYAVQDLIRSEDFRKFFETEYADIVKSRKNYKSLKKIFLTLAVLNIILITCAVSVISVMLMPLRIGNDHVTSDKISLDAAMEEFVVGKLDSPRAKEIIRQHASCDDCRRMNDKLETYDTNIQKVRKSIDKLEDEVIALQQNGSNIKPGGFQKTAVHERVEENGQLINRILNWKRSSMQLVGGFSRGQVVWQKDLSNGNIMAYKNKGIHVMGGGTYFLYTKIKFLKNNCTGNEMFEYDVMRDKGSTTAIVSNTKQGCSVHGSFDQSLYVQKLVEVPLRETATFYIRFKSGFLSGAFRTHVFGMIEI
ncbi:uncharacterized protein LOC123553902 [Mercenaria mercenaria]|uniref:uncharacterized protein LOC123553902 n=1 Tax=Mercenaria mercenaria TaxID=6596 RepID=UPI001E1D62DA|nr:uncharacterized protein LOC123553902 [Mercenaria mercenaria]